MLVSTLFSNLEHCKSAGASNTGLPPSVINVLTEPELIELAKSVISDATLPVSKSAIGADKSSFK